MLWVPVYLLIMQTRVYRQGRPTTRVKDGLIGWFYLWLLTFALLTTFVLGVTH